MFDVAVIGLGAMGSAALYELARRGRRVVGLERFKPGHNRGSSHGESRAFRLAHFEGSHYCELARHALAGWRQLEKATGQDILTQNGVLECGPDGSPNVRDSLQAAIDNGLDFELMSSREVMARFPAFRLPAHWRGVFQKDGGFLRPEPAIRSFLQIAKDAGAKIRSSTKVAGIEPRGAAMRVNTDNGFVEAGSVIVTAGSWIGDLVPLLRPHLTLTREVQLWFKPERPDLFTPGRFPVFAFEDPENNYYGFPDFAGSGVKAASHDPGRRLNHADEARQDAGAEDGESVRRVLARHIPSLTDAPQVRAETCIYTNTADANFVIDRHPEDQRVVLASPCSGHGFKYAPAIGEILADLALDGSTRHNIVPFSLARLSR